MKINLIIAILMATLFFACDETGKQTKDFKSSFSGEFIKRKKGIKTLLSDQFTLINLNSKKESSFKVGFNLDSGINYLLHPHNGDTLDEFVLLKNKKIYYLARGNYPVDYSLQAISIKSDTIFGWKNESSQMKAIDNMVMGGTLGLDTVSNKYSLLSDKKVLYDLFSDLIKAEEAVFVIKSIGRPDQQEDNSHSGEEATNHIEVSTNDDSVISKVYPNPADDFLNVEFHNFGTYNLEIISTKGDKYYKNQLAGDKIKIDLSGIPNGTHLLLITDTEGNVQGNQKIVVAR